MKYVVKNERGEWLTWIGLWCGPWHQDKALRGRTSDRAEAFEWKRKFGGKVYRVRRLTARREREAIVALLKRRRDSRPLHGPGWVELDLAIQEVEARHVER